MKNVDYGILSWTHYLNLMVHYYCLSKLDMAGLSSRSSRGLLEVCSIEYTKCLLMIYKNMCPISCDVH